jgi:hypothetical protein
MVALVMVRIIGKKGVESLKSKSCGCGVACHAAHLLHHGTGIELPLSKQMNLELPQMLRAEPVGRPAEIGSQFMHRTDISPHSALGVVSTLEFFQHHGS